ERGGAKEVDGDAKQQVGESEHPTIPSLSRDLCAARRLGKGENREDYARKPPHIQGPRVGEEAGVDVDLGIRDRRRLVARGHHLSVARDQHSRARFGEVSCGSVMTFPHTALGAYAATAHSECAWVLGIIAMGSGTTAAPLSAFAQRLDGDKGYQRSPTPTWRLQS